MSKQICLSVEQMKNLEKLGLDTSDSSMMYYLIIDQCDYILTVTRDGFPKELYKEKPETYIPAYTLQDIINIIPDYIDVYELQINKTDIRYTYPAHRCLKYFEGENILEASYNMLLWCIENNYIKTNKI